MRDRIARRDANSVALAGGLLAAAAAAIAIDGGQPDSAGLAERYATTVALPIATGLYAWRDGRHARFGRLLVLVGLIWFLPSLSASGDAIAHSVGRVAAWLLEPALVFAVLAFPTGRLNGRVDCWIVAAAAANALLLFAPTALMIDGYPEPSPWSTCRDCPANVLMVLGAEPAFVDSAIVPLREFLITAIMAATALRVAQRMRTTTPLMRRTLAPVAIVADLRTVSLAIAFGLRRTAPTAEIVEAATWLVAVSMPAMSIGFLVGLLRWRLMTADALLRLANAMRHDPRPPQLRELIADALGDPSAELAYRDNSATTGWIDRNGQPTTLPLGEPGRHVTVVDQAGRPVAAIVHDAALADQHRFVAAVGDYALTWEDNQRLAERVQTSLDELRRSRARILAAADDERRRIERDLHDAGQQRLVALRLRLELADRTMQRDPQRARALLEQVAADVDAAMGELRTLAAGVYPAVLAERGLAEALRSAASRSQLPVQVTVEGVETRYPRAVETATYFCCLEALQNVAKHAPDASTVTVDLAFDERGLRFSVCDDGPGMAGARGGSGLQNMRDRMAAIGGTLQIESAPGAGTTVWGSVPVRSLAAG